MTTMTTTDDHPSLGPHRKCDVDHGGADVPDHCRRGCKWPCPNASQPGRFRARYPGKCGACDQDIVPGSVVYYDGDELEHVVCPQPQRALGQACARCLTTHPGEC